MQNQPSGGIAVFDPPVRPRQKIGHARRLLDCLGLEHRAKDSAQIAHFLGEQEVVLHEPLDMLEAAAGGVAKPFGEIGLQFKAQPVDWTGRS